MKTRFLTTLAFLLALVLVPLSPMFEASPAAAQEPQATQPAPPLPPGSTPEKKDKSSSPAPQGGPNQGVSPTAAGGPDAFGYTWQDTTYSWLAGTVDTLLGGDDAFSSPLDIGFNFNFYGHNYTKAYASTNGLLTFGQGSGAYDNIAIPDILPPNNFIAPFWDDLYVKTTDGYNGRVYTRQGSDSHGQYFVVEWRNVATNPNPAETRTFEVILRPDGRIGVQYQALSGGLTECTVGIENGLGTTGLLYLYDAPGLSSSKAILFSPPAPTPRVEVAPINQGRFTSPGVAQSFKLQVTNTGGSGSDTFDLIPTSAWPVSFFAANGTTPLTDTNGNGRVDTGSVAQGATVDITAKVATPTSTGVGSNNRATITARSGHNTGRYSSVTLDTAVPAPFAQIYQDPADGAMSLALVQPSGQSVKQATPPSYGAAGRLASVAEIPNGNFVYVWNKFRWNGTVYVDEIEYTILSRNGATVKPVTRLIDLSAVIYETQDFCPAVAVTPDGHIGLTWYRQIRIGSSYNFNTWFASLNGDGSLASGPANLTNNLSSADWYSNGFVRFENQRIAATDDNKFFVTWSRYEQGASNHSNNIYFTIRSTGGAIVKGVTNFTNSAMGGPDMREPSCASLSGNRVLLGYWNTALTDGLTYAVLDSAGNTVKSATTLGSSSGGSLNAKQLANGRIIVTWTYYDGSEYRIAYALLDGTSYVVAVAPKNLTNPLGVGGNDYVSITADSSGRAILTWTDGDSSYNPNPYYALLDGNGAILTPPMAFYTSQNLSNLQISVAGYGNTTFSGGVYLPVILDNAYGGWTTGANIRNTSPFAAKVQVTYYNSSGAPVATDTQTLAAYGYWGNYQGGKFGAGWTGSAVIYSLANVVATVNEVGPSYSMGYSGESSASNALYFPGIMDNALGGWTTGINIKNVSPTAASVTLRYYKPTGALISTKSYTIPGYGYIGVYQGGALGSGVVGAALLTSSQPVVGVINEVHTSGNSVSHNGLATPGKAVNLPIMLNGAFGGWSTWVHLQNTSANGASGSIKYYDNAGVLKKTTSISLPGRGSTNLNTASAGLPAGYTGSAIVTMSQPVVAMVNEFASGKDGMGYEGVVNGQTPVNVPVVMDHAYGGWTSMIGIQNPGSIGTTVTIYFYDPNGASLGAAQQAIPPYGSWNVSESGVLGSGKAGSARILSGRPLAVIVNEYGPSGNAIGYNATP